MALSVAEACGCEDSLSRTQAFFCLPSFVLLACRLVASLACRLVASLALSGSPVRDDSTRLSFSRAVVSCSRRASACRIVSGG